MSYHERGIHSRVFKTKRQVVHDASDSAIAVIRNDSQPSDISGGELGRLQIF